MNVIRVLFVATSHDKLGDTEEKTGVWLEEMAAPYYVFREAGAELSVASPKGGRIPLDPKSLALIIATRNTKQFLKDAEAMDLLANATPLSDIDSSDFDLVFMAGGHGALWDLTDNDILKQLLESFETSGKPIGAVGHGVAGLLSLQSKGKTLVMGRRITGSSNREEESAGLTGVLPFLLETKLLALDANYSKGENYVNHVIADGTIITGQNPASATEVAKRVIALVKHQHFIPAF